MTTVDTLREVAVNTSYLYSLVFLVGIALFKKQTSLVITSTFLAIAEFIMQAINDPVREFFNDKSVEYVLRLSGWIVFWSLVALFIIAMLQKVHQWLNIAKGRELKVVQSCYVVVILLHGMFYINAMFLGTTILDMGYRYGILIMNIGIALYLLTELLIQARKKYA
ncbi:hypothetical protein KIH87_11740 [Paraneptunicella aestuarii]|uniref:hypothetical protein n=1 Tax=Paraneptunicella aestuarii TaxID=2831148 RepID=UPI001E32018F|nr:hypothetical protein [Paraneptunicella aestuarii]UAA37386.1 hypothetical protein KIH87_11740 [Paraneptunicella aestuarii]